MKCSDMKYNLDAIIYNHSDTSDWRILSEAIFAAGWRPKDLEHSWKKIPFGGAQVQLCENCDETRAHSCLFSCDEHENPTEEQVSMIKEWMKTNASTY